MRNARNLDYTGSRYMMKVCTVRRCRHPGQRNNRQCCKAGHLISIHPVLTPIIHFRSLPICQQIHSPAVAHRMTNPTIPRLQTGPTKGGASPFAIVQPAFTFTRNYSHALTHRVHPAYAHLSCLAPHAAIMPSQRRHTTYCC